MDYIVRAFQYQPKLILSSDQVLVICLRWGFRCSLCASQAVFALTLLQESTGRIRTEFLLQCQIWEITANPHGLSTPTLFYGYKPWYHRTLLQNLSPWLKKLQCNGNSTSQACMLLKRRGNDYCKAGTKTGINFNSQKHDRATTKYVEPLCSWDIFRRVLMFIACYNDIFTAQHGWYSNIISSLEMRVLLLELTVLLSHISERTPENSFWTLLFL